MQNKKYGYIIGRFSPITKGHERLIKYALENVDVLLIVIGSADKKNTFRNPYRIATRIKLIKKIYAEEIESGKIILKPLADLSDEADVNPDGRWGRYLLKHVEDALGRRPDASIFGTEEARQMWYKKEDIEGIKELVIDRTSEDISATKVRLYLAKGDRENFEKCVNEKLHSSYEELRKELFNVEEYINIARGK